MQEVRFLDRNALDAGKPEPKRQGGRPRVGDG
jgi:hypothetical protein